MSETSESEAKRGRSYDQEAELSREFYYNENYFKMPALASLCEQIVRIYNLKPASLLEIGKGNGFVSEYLKGAGIPITTFDINPNLKPDVVGNALELEKHFKEDEFDYVLCAEVLEHIPYEEAKVVLEQISKVCKAGALITIPRCQNVRLDFQGRLSFWLKGRREYNINLFHTRKRKTISKLHHWELNHSPETSIAKVTAEIEKHFVVKDSTRCRLCPYHQFFTLEKKR